MGRRGLYLCAPGIPVSHRNEYDQSKNSSTCLSHGVYPSGVSILVEETVQVGTSRAICLGSTGSNWALPAQLCSCPAPPHPSPPLPSRY